MLGVPRSADADAIRTAYRALAKQHHPDLAEGGDSLSTDRFVEIQQAYDVLRHPSRRAQYDMECARREALAAAQRRDQAERERQAQQGLWPAPAGTRVAVRPPPPTYVPQAPRSRFRYVVGWPYVAAALLVVLVLGIVIGQQRMANQQAALLRTTVVKVDPPRSPLEPRRDPRDPNGLSPELKALGREFETLTRQQADRAEARKAEAEAKRIAAETPPQVKPPAPAGTPPADPLYRKVDCRGGGRTLTVVHQNNAVSLSYNGGPMVKPTVKETTAGMVVVSAFEPSNLVSIGFMKGDKDRTVLIITDAAGNVFSSIGFDCSAAAF